MNKIIFLKKLPSLAKKLHVQGKSIVLAGGVFDILHIGHIRFLKTAKTHADLLMVLLESDKKVARLKGLKRPIHSQNERAEMLSSLFFVDYIVLLPFMKNNNEYEALIKQVRPDIIALTEGDIHKKQKQKQAKVAAAKLIEIPKIHTPSTTQLAKLLRLET